MSTKVKNVNANATDNVEVVKFISFRMGQRSVGLITEPHRKAYVNSIVDYDYLEPRKGEDIRLHRNVVKRGDGSQEVYYNVCVDEVPREHLEKIFARNDIEETGESQGSFKGEDR